MPHSSELAGTLGQNKADLKNIVEKLNKDTNVDGCTVETKTNAMKECAAQLKPIQDNVKEGLRRIKVAGLKPSKGSESAESAVEGAGR